MNSHCSKGSMHAVAASGGRPEGSSSKGAGHTAYGGKWKPPQPHEVPSTRLGRGQQHQSCQPPTDEGSQPADVGQRERPSPWHPDSQFQDKQHLPCPLGHGYGPPLPQQGTTVIVWHLPERFDLACVLDLWPMDGTFNYLEVPFSASERCHKGRAIINFASCSMARRFVSKWKGRWVHGSQKEPLEVRLAHIQGLRRLLERFQGKNIQKLDSHGCLPLVCNGTTRLNTRDVLTMLFRY